MKINYAFISAIILVFTSSLFCFGFGKVGHATVAQIAENHLTPKAKANIAKYIGGVSITQIASWMDSVRRTPEYKFTDPWHVVSIDSLGKIRYERATAELPKEIDKLSNGRYKSLSDSAVSVGIKLIVHMTGDMHCPSHSRFDMLPQKAKFKFNDNQIGFHKFFDVNIIELAYPDFGYIEYAKQLDVLLPSEIKELQQGTVQEWAQANSVIMEPLYDLLPDGAIFEGDDAEKWIKYFINIEDRQLQLGGYRLASILNFIFGEKD